MGCRLIMTVMAGLAQHELLAIEKAKNVTKTVPEKRNRFGSQKWGRAELTWSLGFQGHNSRNRVRHGAEASRAPKLNPRVPQQQNRQQQTSTKTKNNNNNNNNNKQQEQPELPKPILCDGTLSMPAPSRRRPGNHSQYTNNPLRTE